jgi:Chaperone of endosialidase
MKIGQLAVGGIVSALFLAFEVHAQNVGIGFTNPKSQLTVNGNFALGTDYNLAAPTNGALIEGDVGIGLTTPQVPLHVDGSIWVAPGGITGSFWNGTANIDGTEIDLYGLIGIQRSAGADICLSKPPGYTNLWLVQMIYNNSTIGTISTNTTSNPTGVVYGTTSDLRLKENIRPTAKGINDLMRIQVSDFNFKSNPATTETGFIAQQIYTVLPEVVTKGGSNPITEPWTVDYGRVTPLLTRAIQEQQGEINGLKQQNGKVTSRLAAVESENASLKAEVAQLKASNEKLAAMAAEIEGLEKTVSTIQRKENSEISKVALNQ